MKKLFAAVALVAVAAVASPARAEDTGVSLALRSGFALPMGDFASGVALSDGLSGNIPIWVDVGYRFNPNIFAGGYFQYGIGLTKNCTGSCSASVVRFGIEGIYNFMPAATFAPWAGLGIGYEILNAPADISFKGFEFVNLQLGGDYRLSPQFALGPFVALSLAKYSTASQGSLSGDIVNTSAHEWLQIGVKGTFNL